MVTLFNRKKLYEDYSSMEIARITELLKVNNISYETRTKRNQSNIDMALHSSMTTSIGHGGAYAGGQAIGNLTFLYRVYVSRADYEKAKKLIEE